MALRRALVLGADGALGSSVRAAFENAGWEVVAVVEPPTPPPSRSPADESTPMASGAAPPSSWAASLAALSGPPPPAAPALPPLDAVICAAGGWVGGGAGETAVALASGVERMSAVCVQPAVAAAHLACLRLRPGGLLVLVGSAAALAPTPSMIAYGMAKAATHHLVISLAAPDGGLPPHARALGVLPTVLDTPGNRKFMSAGADTSAWTPCSEVANKVVGWAVACATGDSGAAVPSSGTLLLPETVAGCTSWRELRTLYAPSQLK